MKNNPQPLYLQIADELDAGISNGSLPTGHRLTEKELARQFHTSRPTLRKALDILSNKSLILRIPGKGTFVSRPEDVKREHHRIASLKTANHVVGVLVPNVEVSLYPGIIRGIESVLVKQGYGLALGNYDQSPEKEKLCMEMFVDQGVSGLIVAASFNSSDNPFYSSIREIAIPLVLVDTPVPGVNADFVATDGFRGAYDGTCALFESGCTRPVFLSGPTPCSPSRPKTSASICCERGYARICGAFSASSLHKYFNTSEPPQPKKAPYLQTSARSRDEILAYFGSRLDGFKTGLDERGMAIDPSMVCFAEAHTAESARQVSREILSRQCPPDGILAAGEIMGTGLLQAIRELPHTRHPHINISCFDLDTGNMDCPVPVNSIIQPRRDIGRTAAEMLLERLNEDSSDRIPFRKVLLAPETRLAASAS